MTCPFCGLEFAPAQAGGSGASCTACPLHRWACGRRLACCPRCGYQSPLPRRKSGLPRRWLAKQKKEPVHGAE